MGSQIRESCRVETARSNNLRRRGGAALIVFGAVLALGAAGCNDGGGGSDSDLLLEAVLHWNTVAVDASGLDHVPPNQGPPHEQHQIGPCRASRAMAIVHLALFETILARHGGYQSYVGVAPVTEPTSDRAGIAQAVRDTLVALYPSQASLMDQALTDALSQIPNGAEKTRGIALGQTVAQAVLALRANDGSALPEPLLGSGYITSDQPGRWRQDPISQVTIALGANWPQVTPFLLTSADLFRCPPPPALSSPEYALAFNEAKVLGGDGVTTPTVRSSTAEQIGIFWAYDGTPSLCAPPRLYNQVARTIAMEQGLSGVAMARFLATLNLALADAAISAWDSKYFYDYWRPVHGIREADAGTGPTGLGDGNPQTLADLTFTPLGAPASNTSGPNFTPPFPAYPSGHATFGGALFQVIRRTFETDQMPFTFVSDEYNGTTLDVLGQVRARKPRSFDRLSDAEEENGHSRIYLGIHWSFDKTAGINQGRQVADFVFDRVFAPN